MAHAEYRLITEADKESPAVRLVVKKFAPDGDAYADKLGKRALWNGEVWVYPQGHPVEYDVLGVEI